MRILLLSDMHGEMKHALAALEEVQAELLICAGDWGDAGTVPDETYEFVLSRAPTFSVFGNHDDLDLLRQLKNKDGTPVLLQNGEIVEHGGLKISGINGIWAKSHKKPYYVLDEEVLEAARKLEGKGVDILVTHGCPIGIGDFTPKGGHGGQRCFLDALKIVQPRLYLCGHLHRPQSRHLKSGTLVLNIGYTAEGDYAVIEMDAQRCELVRHVKVSFSSSQTGLELTQLKAPKVRSSRL